jgi:hypothetical protein
VGSFFNDDERAVIAAAAARVLPGASADGYIDQLLGAFSFDPPRIWAGGPYSGRHGGEPSFEEWIPLGPMEQVAWQRRIEGWQNDYQRLLAALGADFVDLGANEQDARLAAVPELRDLLYEHACEGTYGDPVYGGNKGFVGWDAIGWVGDVQPRGYTDVEVAQRDKTLVERRSAEG